MLRKKNKCCTTQKHLDFSYYRWHWLKIQALSEKGKTDNMGSLIVRYQMFGFL